MTGKWDGGDSLPPVSINGHCPIFDDDGSSQWARKLGCVGMPLANILSWYKCSSLADFLPFFYAFFTRTCLCSTFFSVCGCFSKLEYHLGVFTSLSLVMLHRQNNLYIHRDHLSLCTSMLHGVIQGYQLWRGEIPTCESDLCSQQGC